MASFDSRRGSEDDTTVFVSSGLQMEERKINWEIKMFDVLRQSDGLLWTQRYDFAIGTHIGMPTTWSFYLTPESEKFYGIFFELVKKPTNADEVNISFVIKVNKRNGSKFFLGTAELKNMADPTIQQWGFPTFIARDAVLKDVLTDKGALIIEADFKLYSAKPVKSFNLQASINAFETCSLKRLSKEMGELPVLECANADHVTRIISKDGKEFSVIKAILAGRSPVFLRMFQTKMIEAETGKVNIDDLSTQTISVLLRYIYTGTLHKDWKTDEVLEELMIAAHRYELTLLTQFLDAVLGNVCHAGNAKRLATLARKLDMKKAEMELFAYIKENAASLDDVTIFTEKPSET